MTSIYHNDADAIDGNFSTWEDEPTENAPAPQPAASTPRPATRRHCGARRIKRVTAIPIAAYLIWAGVIVWQILAKPVQLPALVFVSTVSVVLISCSIIILAGAYRR